MTNFWQKLDKPILALAPMAGVTDLAFRIICRKAGADLVYSEMISADGLFYQSPKTLAMLETVKAEQPLVIQLFGKDPAKFTQAAAAVEQAGAAGIDLNFGCPARKVVAHGGGVTLLKDLNLCYQIVKATLAGTKLPVSLKLRTAINTKNGRVTALDFLKKVADLDLKAIMIHGRTYEQKFDGPIDWQMIREARKYFNGIILANGGITSPEIAQEILEKTQADGLGIARGSYGQPWLFQQIKDYLKSGKYSIPDWPARKKIILQHAQLALKHNGDHGLIELRKHLLWYVKGLANASDLRKLLVTIKTLKDIEKIFSQI